MLLKQDKRMTALYWILILAIIFLGLVFRLYYINFGLPHSFHADEPEIVELAIKYTYEFKDIITNNNYYKLIPISFVYGTFPSYFFTIFTMLFSKTNGLLGISFPKENIYIFLRVINALISLAIPILAAHMCYKLFNKLSLSVITLFFLSCNWKLIVHAHYINADNLLVVLLLIAIWLMLNYYNSLNDTKYTLLAGLFFGLAVGTKITALISLPMFIYIFLVKRTPRNLFGFLFTAYGAFIFSNPFSLIYASDFSLRIYEMLSKEGGIVFDSVNYSYFKYFGGLCFILTPAVFIVSIYGLIKALRITNFNTIFSNQSLLPYHIFLIGQAFIYILFYSVQARYVDRWLLPIIPILIIYGVSGFIHLKGVVLLYVRSRFISNLIWLSMSFFIICAYLYFPLLLLTQLKRYTPKSEAYLWAQTNLPVSANKFVITEEGLDPMNKLPGTLVKKFEVYSVEGAQFSLPPDPSGYDYVILSSKPMSWFKNTNVKEAYPFYYKYWQDFEDQILGPNAKFELVKSFVLSKPNLLNLSDVYIYKYSGYNPSVESR